MVYIIIEYFLILIPEKNTFVHWDTVKSLNIYKDCHFFNIQKRINISLKIAVYKKGVKNDMIKSTNQEKKSSKKPLDKINRIRNVTLKMKKKLSYFKDFNRDNAIKKP